jgi:hypothetical protein
MRAAEVLLKVSWLARSARTWTNVSQPQARAPHRRLSGCTHRFGTKRSKDELRIDCGTGGSSSRTVSYRTVQAPQPLQHHTTGSHQVVGTCEPRWSGQIRCASMQQSPQR